MSETVGSGTRWSDGRTLEPNQWGATAAAMRRVTDASHALGKAADQLRGRRWEIAAWCSGAALLGGLVGGALVLIAPKGGMVARLDQIQATIYEIQAAPRPGTVQSKPPRK